MAHKLFTLLVILAFGVAAACIPPDRPDINPDDDDSAGSDDDDSAA
ncbi:MAG: hypothetical protein GY898_17690 [Proteobacteria bacterium]|nr:hypothetical protein [Pseudomonadota bacterium]